MAPLPRPSAPSFTLLRMFSSSASCLAKSHSKRLAFQQMNLPPYPYGPSPFYKQSNFGLYGLQKIRYGNIVSDKNEIKTRRHWRPNVHSKRLWSGYLGKYIRIRVTTRVMRTIDKCGGLDEYLLGEKAARIRELGTGGWALRWRVMATEGAKERFSKERAQMGLPPRAEPVLGIDGSTVAPAQQAREIRQFDEELAREDAELVFEDEIAASASPEEKFMEEVPARSVRATL
ncbi:MAG: 39S ribosomal protein L24, mitochondrial [Claussenomyces sp. TS43310]|nr:MAG: 39S ribosomal protein L24, mitochondrial [Claussenomyces sp. TS43310]